MIVRFANMGRRISSTMDPRTHLSEAEYAMRWFTGSLSVRAPGG